jgi:beta-galactosidase
VNRRKFNQLAGMAGIGALVGRNAISATIPSQTGKQSATRGRGMGEGYLLGAAYYPEWWPEAEWEVDFREMQQLGINTVRMGEFAWAIFEPAPGKFTFEWMDRAIATATRHSVSVILGTPTASVPPWLYALHPDVLSGNDLGPYTYGGRKGYCTSSENYLDACARIVTALAEHYGNNPGVIGWQLDNEPGHPPQAYDPVTEKAFQAWLEKRYGTLEKLNREWNGAFWSNLYSDWSQIKIPRNSAEGGWQPAISLAYRRFFSDSFLNHLRRQAVILKARIQNQFIFTNWPAPTWSVDTFAAAADFLDATAWDNYVSAPGLSRFQRQYIAGFLSDFCRCAGPQQRFLCAEQNAYVPPIADDEGLRLQAYCDLAHGSHGQIFFEWRRPAAGNEEHRPSFIKGFDGELNAARARLAQIAKEMARLGPQLAGATTKSEIALLYDFSNEWAQGYGGIGDQHPRYNGEMQAFYGGLKELKRNIDVVPLGADYSRYKLLVASNLRLIDDSTAARIIQFVADGGTLLLNDRAGTENTENGMRLTLSPGPFTEIAGVHAEAMLDLSETNPQNGTLEQSQEEELGIVFAGADAVFHPRTIVEALVLRGAEPIASLRGGLMAGRPAVTRNRYGKGWVFYSGVDCLEDGFYESLARIAGATAKLDPLIAAPYGVEVTSREDATSTYYFLLNLTETPHEKIPLPRPMDDMIEEHRGITQIPLGPLEVAVLAATK